MLCFVGAERCQELHKKVTTRLSMAFRPKTRLCYQRLFRVFVGFCISVNVALHSFSVVTVLCFLEYLMHNNVSVGMIINYVSAVKAMAILYNIPHDIFEHPRVKYFIKSIKMSRPILITKRNVMDVNTLTELITLCDNRPNAVTFKANFLTAFFGFFRLSNLAPHATGEFDQSKHLTGGDVFFDKNQVKILLKWSKTLQFNDEVRVITLPRLKSLSICPYRALKAIYKLYAPESNQPLFQWVIRLWLTLESGRL